MTARGLQSEVVVEGKDLVDSGDGYPHLPRELHRDGTGHVAEEVLDFMQGHDKTALLVSPSGDDARNIWGGSGDCGGHLDGYSLLTFRDRVG